MTEGTARRRGRGKAQEADRHVGARIRERRVTLGLTQERFLALGSASRDNPASCQALAT